MLMSVRRGYWGMLACLAIVPSGCETLWGVSPLPGLSVQVRRAGCSEFTRSARLTAATSETGLTFRWFFPDGVALDGQAVLHTFESRGTYPVTLVATRPDGSERSVRTQVTIPVAGPTEAGATDPFGDRCVANEGEQHIASGTSATYRANPRASGPHYSQAGVAPAAPGFYDTAVRPEVWVHNLEHGHVVFLYDCPGDCSQDLLNQLRSLFDATPPDPFGGRRLVITRYHGLTVPIMAVAWDTQREFATIDSAGLIAFYRRHVGEGPE